MNRSSQPRLRLSPLQIAALGVGLHLVLREILIHVDVVSVILSAGAHTPVWMLFAAVAFAVVRLIAFLVLPGVVAWAMVLGVAAWIGDGRRTGPAADFGADPRGAGNRSPGDP